MIFLTSFLQPSVPAKPALNQFGTRRLPPVAVVHPCTDAGVIRTHQEDDWHAVAALLSLDNMLEAMHGTVSERAAVSTVDERHRSIATLQS